jgi:hypothetical protein
MIVLATRYAFTPQFVAGSVLLARRAAEIEAMPDADEIAHTEHRSLVVAAIMQATAAIETELSEIVMHGPGCHLGSGATDTAARDFLSALEPLIDKQSGVLNRWQTLLYLLKRPAFDKGAQPYQGADLLVSLRNELVHHKSQWGGALTRNALIHRLMEKRFAVPNWVLSEHNDFPFRILVADCAEWASRTSAAFIDHAYEMLGVVSVLDHNRTPGSMFAPLLPPRSLRS